MNRQFRSPTLRVLATAAVLTCVLVPGLARASGSWAVPRFTPTWAELERDLRLLGLKKRPPAKPRPIAVKPAAAPTVAGTVPPAQTSPGAEAGASGTPTPTSNAPGENTPGTADQFPPGTPLCRCSEPPPPPPKCPEVAPAAVAAPVDAKPDKKTGKPGKKAPADSKKLDRKKYWWQEE